ncbi:MAG: L,D-transpeptidase family protein [Halioglobus sp.]|nr:L,D-transpeptidase family protein [Halioglobus sp.]
MRCGAYDPVGLFLPPLLHYRCRMKCLAILLSFSFSTIVVAETFDLPSEHFDVIGSMRTVQSTYEDTLLDIARRANIGQNQMERVNPDVDRWIPGEGTLITVPSHYVLPRAQRKGVVLNLPEMRMYYFPPKKPGQPAQVQTYPISIGRMDWATPLGMTKITSKTKDPSWRPTESIRREHAEKGDPLPRVVPAGPNNPLGAYAMRLGMPTYLIHGTNKPLGVGMRVSHGCIRMLPEDIEHLFAQLPVGTPVNIINQPVKAGWYGGKLYLEVHPGLEEYPNDRGAMVEAVMAALDDAMYRRSAELDNAIIDQAIDQQNGLPQVITIGG